MYNKIKHKDKKYICLKYLQCFDNTEILINHKKVCLEISGKQSVNMTKNSSNVQFTNYYKELQSLFLICANKSILLVVMVTKIYLLMIFYINICRHIQVKKQFTRLFKNYLKKFSIRKKIL